jgi:hypothetical protein
MNKYGEVELGAFLASAVDVGGESHYPLYTELVGPQIWSGRCAEQKYFLSHKEIEPDSSVVQSVV